MSTSPDVSVVVPVFNSAETLRTLFDAIQHESTALSLNADVIFVDDGSTDDSWRVILELNAQHGSRVRGIRLARNCGQQAATYCGLLEADGEWVVTIDDDLQAHPREIRKLWEQAQAAHADVVYGVYATLEHRVMHRIGSRLFRILLRRFAPDFPDGSSFRLIRASVVRSIPRAPGPWVLVDPILARHTSDFTSVVVEHGRRETGRSGYSIPRLFGMACTLLFTYSRIPLRLMTGIGLISAISSFALGLYYLFQKLTADAQIGFSALIVTITFSSGVILLSLGILGEYISRLHAMGSGEAAFTIKARAVV